MDLKDYIRNVPGFPKKGIIFKDITPLLKNGKAFDYATRKFLKYAESKKIDVVAGIESRGFILGSVVANRLGVGFIPLRKKGKLPWTTISETFSLEYGTASMEVHIDSFKKDQKVLILDDLLATGGTALAACNLVKRLGGQVSGLAVLVELEFLHGREKLNGYDVFSLLRYES